MKVSGEGNQNEKNPSPRREEAQAKKYITSVQRSNNFAPL